MSRTVFGWSYPPGAASDPNAPWNQEEGPCEVCCKDVTDCICPECPTCGEQGNPKCYTQDHENETGMPAVHGRLKITREQAISRAECEVQRAKMNYEEAKMAVEYLQQEGSEFSEDLADYPDPWR